MPKKNNNQSQRHQTSTSTKSAHRFRSKFEHKIAEQITNGGLSVEYETDKIAYVVPSRIAILPTLSYPKPGGFYAEVKGRWLVEDRHKHLLIKEQHPDLDIRFMFQTQRQNSTKVRLPAADYCTSMGLCTPISVFQRIGFVALATSAKAKERPLPAFSLLSRAGGGYSF